MPYKDPEKQRKAQRESAKRNRAYMRQYAAQRRRELAQYVQRQKTKPCTDCGKTFHPCVMDFDHVRGEKVASLSVMINNRERIETIDAEIAKCELVCANCHRLRHKDRCNYVED